jgi:DNA polymerase sigma
MTNEVQMSKFKGYMAGLGVEFVGFVEFIGFQWRYDRDSAEIQ